MPDSVPEPRASQTYTSDDDPTRMMPAFVPPPKPEPTDTLKVFLARGAAHLDAALTHGEQLWQRAAPRVAQLWREGPLRTAAMMAGVALVTYLAVGGTRHNSTNYTQTILLPATALPATALPAVAAPIIVEQLNSAPQPQGTLAAPPRNEQFDTPGRRSAASAAHETSFATPPARPAASKNSGYQVIAPAQYQPRRPERSSTSVPSSSAGLPAWGAEVVRDFSSGKSGKSATATSPTLGLTAKPPASSASADIPPPMAAYRSSAPEQTKPAPVVAAKPPEPPKPAAPPPPAKPMTMDQVLNQVEEIAQAQRKQAGLKAPKSSKRDEELDELITGAMKSKK